MKTFTFFEGQGLKQFVLDPIFRGITLAPVPNTLEFDEGWAACLRQHDTGIPVECPYDESRTTHLEWVAGFNSCLHLIS